MTTIPINIAGERFEGVFRDDLAPKTCASFRQRLPFINRMIHVRWSGEGCWIPLGDMDLAIPFENPTSYPEPGEIVVYPGGVSETEILVAYGPVCFASKAGQLAGNPLLKIHDRLDVLGNIGRDVLWNGSCDIVFG